MQATHIELLQGMPVFGALRDDSLRLLLEGAREVVVRGGTHFFHEGDAANSMFVLQSGNVAVHKHWQGQELRLHVLGAGDCFGEMALMDLLPRSASVRAENDCRAIEFSSADLMLLYEHDVEQFALSIEALSDWSPWPCYPRIVAPTLLLAGEREDPDHLAAGASALMREATARWLPGLGHIGAFLDVDNNGPLIAEHLHG